MLEIKVTEEMAGRRIYSLLRHDLMLSASLIKRIKWSDGIYVNGEPVHTRYELKTDDNVSVDLHAGETETGLVCEEGPLDILFENDDFLAVNKPTGILVHPSRSRYTGTLANYAAGYLANTSGESCHAVNRLDRDTSGIVLFAKNSRAKTLAIKHLKESGSKMYFAVVCGIPTEKEGTFDMPIKRVSPDSMLRTVSEDGAPSVTYYKVAAEGLLDDEPISLLSLRLGTGRTHQIRVHCLAAGIPLLGDPQYYTDASRRLSENNGLTLQLLHAASLSFNLIGESEPTFIEAPINRDDFKKILSSMKIYY